MKSNKPVGVMMMQLPSAIFYQSAWPLAVEHIVQSYQISFGSSELVRNIPAVMGVKSKI
jgi:hypothetical protein